MTEVLLHQRGELPPGRVGAVKPPRDLADLSPEIDLALTGAKFAGDKFNQLVDTRAATEKAVFHGSVNTILEEWKTSIAANPGAGYGELQVQRDKMMDAITAASQLATTVQGKQDNADWLEANTGPIRAQSQTAMMAIRSKQELDAYGLRRKKDMTDFDDTEYVNDQENMIRAGLLNRKVAMAQREIDLDIMFEAEKELLIGNELAVAREIFDVTGDTKQAIDYIRNSEIVPEKDKQPLQQDLVVEAGYRQTIAKRESDARVRSQTELVFKDVNEGNYSGINARIDAMPDISEEQKTQLKDTVRRHVEAERENKLQDSPFNQSNPAVFGRLLGQVRNDPLSITNPELLVFAGKGLEDGITIEEYNQLSVIHDSKLAALEKVDAEPDALKHDSVQRAHASIGRTRSFAIGTGPDAIEDPAERRAIEAEYQSVQNQLDEFAGTLKADDPDFGKKIEAETKRLLTPRIEEVTLGFFQKFFRVSERAVVTGRLARVTGSSEEAALARKRIKVFRESEGFESLDSSRQAEAERLIEQGLTVQDAIDRVSEEITETLTEKERARREELRRKAGLQ